MTNIEKLLEIASRKDNGLLTVLKYRILITILFDGKPKETQILYVSTNRKLILQNPFNKQRHTTADLTEAIAGTILEYIED